MRRLHSRVISSRVRSPRLEKLEDRSLLTGGMLDPTFGIGGKTISDFGSLDPSGAGNARPVVAMPDGRIVVGGTIASGASTTSADFAVERFNADGSPDSSFGVGGKATIDFGSTNDDLTAIAVQPDGKIIAVGQTGLPGQTGTGNNVGISRLNADGTLDTTFNGTGKQVVSFGVTSKANGVTLQPDGSLLIYGSAAIAEVNELAPGDGSVPTTVFAIARLTPQGELDSSFGSGGEQQISFSIYDSSLTAGSVQGYLPARAEADAATVLPDGSILLVGSSRVTPELINAYDVYPEQYQIAEAKLTPDGQLDGNFAYNQATGNYGRATISLYNDSSLGGSTPYEDIPILNFRAQVVAAAFDADGNAVVDCLDPQFHPVAIRMSSDGTLDQSFGNGGVSPTLTQVQQGQGFSRTMALAADGRILIAGRSFGPTSDDFAVGRLLANGQPDPNFGSGGIATVDINGNNDDVTSLAVQDDANILLAGFSTPDLNTVVGNSLALARLKGFDFSVAGTQGDDTINVAPGTQPGTLKTTVNGVVTDNVVLDDELFIAGLGGNDIVTINAGSTATIFVSGNLGSDQLMALGTSANDYIFKNDRKIIFGNPEVETISYRDVESVTIHGGDGDDTIIDPGHDTHIYGDAGNDNIVVSGVTGSGVTVDGGSGINNIEIQDSGSKKGDMIAETSTGITVNGAPVTVSGVDSLSLTIGAASTFTAQGALPIPVIVQGPSDTTVVGTAGDDRIRLSATSDPAKLKIQVNSVVLSTPAPSGFMILYGMAGNDTISAVGTSVPVVIDGGDGNDSITGSTGDDKITDLSGNNVIHAGKGNDTVTVGDGNNLIYTDGGDDSVTAGNGNNEIHAGQGTNAIFVGNGANLIYTGGGIDSITAGDGANQIHAGGQSDTILVGNGNNQIWGEGGADVITAGDGNNTITAGAGDDTVIVGNGSNTIKGGSGNDNITAGGGNNTISGGVGNDTITITGNGKNTIDGGDGNDAITVTGNGNNTITAGAGDDAVIVQGSGNNTIDAGAGDDYVKTGSGNDTIDGGDGNDIIFGGLGDDVITGGAGNDFLIGEGGNDKISGGAGNDILVAGNVASGLTLAALQAISQAWANAHTANLGLADDIAINETDDGIGDGLTGGAGADLFIINTGDTIKDFTFGNPNANKDGDVVIEDGMVTT